MGAMARQRPSAIVATFMRAPIRGSPNRGAGNPATFETGPTHANPRRGQPASAASPLVFLIARWPRVERGCLVGGVERGRFVSPPEMRSRRMIVQAKSLGGSSGTAALTDFARFFEVAKP